MRQLNAWADFFLTDYERLHQYRIFAKWAAKARSTIKSRIQNHYWTPSFSPRLSQSTITCMFQPSLKIIINLKTCFSSNFHPWRSSLGQHPLDRSWNAVTSSVDSQNIGCWTVTSLPSSATNKLFSLFLWSRYISAGSSKVGRVLLAMIALVRRASSRSVLLNLLIFRLLNSLFQLLGQLAAVNFSQTKPYSR